MPEALILAPILSSAMGLVGALVAGLSVYLSYKGRHNQFRQAVYGRQMDAYFAIAGAMADLYTAARHALAVSNPRLTGEDARLQFRTVLRQEHEGFAGTVNRSLIVLPSRVKSAVDHFNETLLSIGGPGAGDHPRDRGSDLDRAFERAINCIRHHLAVDSLTTGMLAEMGIGSESVALKGARPGISPLLPVGRGDR